jgi:hypothetical protein
VPKQACLIYSAAIRLSYPPNTKTAPSTVSIAVAACIYRGGGAVPTELIISHCRGNASVVNIYMRTTRAGSIRVWTFNAARRLWVVVPCLKAAENVVSNVESFSRNYTFCSQYNNSMIPTTCRGTRHYYYLTDKARAKALGRGAHICDVPFLRQRAIFDDPGMPFFSHISHQCPGLGLRDVLTFQRILDEK